MELRTLKYFLAVAQEGNITNAAKRLHVTQPTLSRQLADLEKELGRQLYTRGHGGVELTERDIAEVVGRGLGVAGKQCTGKLVVGVLLGCEPSLDHAVKAGLHLTVGEPESAGSVHEVYRRRSWRGDVARGE